MKHQKKSIRLASHVSPARYNITVKPDLESFTFTGEEVIFVTLKKPADKIILHAKELEIVTAECIVGKTDVWAAKISYDDKAETAALQFKKTVPKGNAKLKLSFRGILNDQMRGFYRSKYVHEGKEKFLATTQFEATDARRAFPCFDEPSHKAIFDVTMIVPDHHEAISNTIPSLIREHEAGFKAVRFAPTPKMSTYLLAFISGEFDKIEGYTKRKGKNAVLVRVFTTPGKSHQGKFALDCAIKTLEFFEDYFGINYPLPALDLIAIPDFGSGAMENWGAVTYREAALLVDPENSSLSNRQWVAMVVAHELAHQWFGNLVTMEWWTHLWLNEGFASYIEYLAVDKLFPKWDMWQQFVYLDAGAAFSLDSLSNTHPIEVPVHHPDEISEIFDAISYQKGASIIRMLAGYLGEKNFRGGLRYYLKKHAYKNASTQHLWEALEKISGKSVNKIMKAWTTQPGHPLVTVVQSSKGLKLRQSRFYASKLERLKAGPSSVWPIPVSFAAPGKKPKTILMNQKSLVLNKQSDSVKLNILETGFFRVDYPEALISDFKRAIKRGQLSTEDRYGLLRDSFALAESGQSPTGLALTLVESFRDESDYTVWLQIISGLRAVGRVLEGSKHEELFNAYCRFILQKIVRKLGWTIKKNEGHTDQLLRGVILYNYASFGDTITIHRAKKYFSDFTKGRRTISPDFRATIYLIASQFGGAKELSTILKIYKAESLMEEKIRLFGAMANFRDKLLISRVLTFAFSKQVRYQDVLYILFPAWINPAGKAVTWSFLKKNWKEIIKRYGSGGLLLARILENAELMNDQKFLTDFTLFFKKHEAPGAARTIKQIKERVASNIDWKIREQKKIENWLMDWAKKYQ